ncbi:hypothetical protein KJ616_02610 [Patescibacteria group bacterium]|nr:hypothetical protein [Patescibacteria group bacterium]
MGRQQRDRTLIQKVLTEKNIEEGKDIGTSGILDRNQIIRLQNLMTGLEQKLVKYSPSDRYNLGVYITWTSMWTKLAEQLYDFQESMKKNPKNYSDVGRKNFEDIAYGMSSSIKYLSNIFYFLSRSSMSIDGFAFKEILEQKSEQVYTPEYNSMLTQQKAGLLGSIKQKLVGG